MSFKEFSLEIEVFCDSAKAFITSLVPSIGSLSWAERGKAASARDDDGYPGSADGYV
jgi:hypothetical protein